MICCNVTFSPTSDGSAAAVLASEEFVKKHGLEEKAVEILGMEMATDFGSTFNENSCIKLVSVSGIAPGTQEATVSPHSQVFKPDVCTTQQHLLTHSHHI